MPAPLEASTNTRSATEIDLGCSGMLSKAVLCSCFVRRVYCNAWIGVRRRFFRSALPLRLGRQINEAKFTVPAGLIHADDRLIG